MLKKHELHDRTVQPVVCRDTRHAQGHGPVVCDSSNTRQLGCVFQDMEHPKSSSIIRKSSAIQKPIKRVKVTKAIARHSKIRDKNPSLGMMCPGEPHARSPNAPNFDVRSQEETEWQEQGAREAAWKLAKSVLTFKEKDKATFFPPSENRCLREMDRIDQSQRAWCRGRFHREAPPPEETSRRPRKTGSTSSDHGPVGQF